MKQAAIQAMRWSLNTTARVAPRVAGAYAFRLFLSAGPRAAVRPAERAVHEQAVAERLPVDGKQLAVYRWGDGARPVLLMHGFQGRASNFAAFVPAILEQGLSAVAFDAFGHGSSGGRGSTVLDHEQAIRAVQQRFGPFHGVVAHSFGGFCAFHALREGVAAGRLVTISAVCDLAYITEAFRLGLGLNKEIKRELVRRSEHYFRPEPDVWARYSAAYRPEAITVPVMVIHDQDDREVLVAQGRKIAAAYPQAEFHETTGLGHRRILASPEVVKTTLAFLAGGGTDK